MQALRDGPATRKREKYWNDCIPFAKNTQPFLDYSDIHKTPSPDQPNVIPTDEIPLSPKQTFQQHFPSEDNHFIHSPKVRKLQPRHNLQRHRRSYTNEESGEWRFLTPSSTRTTSQQAAPSIFRTRKEVTCELEMATENNYSFSHRTRSNEYSLFPISRCYSEPMDRESMTSSTRFLPPEPLSKETIVYSFSDDGEITDTLVSAHDSSIHFMRGSIHDDSYSLYQTYCPSSANAMYSSPEILPEKKKRVPFDWMDSPVITRMQMRDKFESMYQDLPYFPRVPSWSNFVTPEKNMNVNPLPYTDHIDEFNLKLETVQSFLEAETVKMDHVKEEKCDESTIATDILPFSLPDVIESYGKSAVGNISPLTTPCCDTSCEFVSTDGDTCASLEESYGTISRLI